MNKTLAGAIVVLILVAVGGMWYFQQTRGSVFGGGLGSSQKLLSSEFAVKDATTESFGDLSKVSIAPATQNANLKTAPTNAMALNQSTAITGSDNAAGGAGADAKMIAPGEPYPVATQYVFRYKGGDLPQLSDSQGVLKRAKPQQPSGVVAQIIKFLSFGLIDLTKLSNPVLSNVTFTEDKDKGYQINVDLEQGNVYAYPNYNRWPQTDCGIIECEISSKQLEMKDVLADEEAIKIAEQFIGEYGISKTGYGNPEVNNTWRVQYENSTPAERVNFYIPQQMQVTYPLVIDGKKIIDEGGNVYGMNLYIDARLKQVQSLSDLVTKQFERSNYKGVTDKDKILQIVEKGGFRNDMYQDPNAKKVTLNLDTPTVETVKMWYSTDNYKTSSEVYVPALVFPVKNWKETNYWRPNIYVPLVEDILNSDNQSVPPVMPLDSVGGTAGGTSSSVETIKPKQ